jgi:hypothetical protein
MSFKCVCGLWYVLGSPVLSHVNLMMGLPWWLQCVWLWTLLFACRRRTCRSVIMAWSVWCISSAMSVSGRVISAVIIANCRFPVQLAFLLIVVPRWLYVPIAVLCVPFGPALFRITGFVYLCAECLKRVRGSNKRKE